MSMLLALGVSMLLSGTGGLVLAGEEVRGTVVIPAEAFPIARYAAEELCYHVEQATGVRLELLAEPLDTLPEGPVVFVGATRAAREAGIAPESLASEAAVLRTVGGHLYLAGNDGPGDALSTGNTHAGTLWAVYEVLDRYLGVRWLWPGALGEVIPPAREVRIPPLDEILLPKLNQRRLRPGLGPRGFAEAHERMAFSPEHRERYAQDQTVFLRRHRMGQSDDSFYAQRRFGSGHAFEGWWETYGEQHPEWFHLLPDGRRGPADPERPGKVTMCVSNPDFHAEIVRRWAEERARRPGEPVNIGVGENDESAECVCAVCTAWDGPQPDPGMLPPGLERSYVPMQASNRYTRFQQAVYALASEIDPAVKVHRYAYLNYFWAPPAGTTLPPNLVVGFVPWFRGAGWFPRAPAEHAWIKDQWLGWHQTGATLYYRPNWFLDGYTMPLVYMHQFADAFQFYARHGMTGTDFDSLQGQWAAQGPNLYLLARIHVRPEAAVEDLLDEYYTAFGPAASQVREYFTYWEDYARDNSPRAVESIRSRRGGMFRRYALYALVADELYPLEVFDPAREILARARDAALAGDAVFQQRVEFLDQGLQHAQQCVSTAAVVNAPDSTAAQRKAAIADLVALRRSLEHTNIANMDRAAIIEADSWKEIEGLFEP